MVAGRHRLGGPYFVPLEREAIVKAGATVLDEHRVATPTIADGDQSALASAVRHHDVRGDRVARVHQARPATRGRRWPTARGRPADQRRVAIEEWLAQIEEFELDPDDDVTWAGGQVRGPPTVPVAFVGAPAERSAPSPGADLFDDLDHGSMPAIDHSHGQVQIPWECP